MANISVTRKDSILDQLDRVRRRIEQRAYQLFRQRDGGLGDALNDWLTAEQELLQKPVMELREKNDVFTIVVPIAGVEPKDVSVDVTDQDMVIKAETMRKSSRAATKGRRAELTANELFGSVHFPRPVDAAKAKADCRRDILTVTVPAALDVSAKRVNIEAA